LIVLRTASFEQKTSQRSDALVNGMCFAVVGDGDAALGPAQHLAFFAVDRTLFVQKQKIKKLIIEYK